MPHDTKEDIKQFHFRHLHPQAKTGTANNRYAGWLGQIYTEERFQGRIWQRALPSNEGGVIKTKRTWQQKMISQSGFL